MNSIQSILTLSLLGTREWIRLKFFNIVIFMSLIFIGFSYLLSTLTFSVQERLLFDFGLAGLEIGLLFISAMIGSYAIHREMDRKTLFVLLIRPIPRWNLIIGFFGAIVILSLIFSIGFSFSLLVASNNWALVHAFIISVFSSFMKSLVISSFALAMGLLVRPILSLVMTFCYWVLCYSMPDIQYFVKKINSESLNKILEIADFITPQFYRMNWKSYYYITNPPLLSELGWVVFYCLGWTFFWLFVAAFVFRRKEIV
ncbi:MAG: ABC transporter permease subunit [Pseudobdellovibrio sp.]